MDSPSAADWPLASSGRPDTASGSGTVVRLGPAAGAQAGREAASPQLAVGHFTAASVHPARSWTADSTRDDRGVLRHRHSLGSPLGRGQQTGEARGGGQWQWHRRNLSSALHPINPGLSPTRRGPAQLAREGGFQEGEGPASPGLAGGAAASPQAPWRVRPSFAGKLRWPRSRGRTDAPREPRGSDVTHRCL